MDLPCPSYIYTAFSASLSLSLSLSESPTMAWYWWVIILVAITFFSKSSAELITALPSQPSNISFKQYSGYITTDTIHGRALFYYFVEANVADPLSRPLTLWLNGGSSILKHQTIFTSFVFIISYITCMHVINYNTNIRPWLFFFGCRRLHGTWPISGGRQWTLDPESILLELG